MVALQLASLVGLLAHGTVQTAPEGDSGTVRVSWSGGLLCIPVSLKGEPFRRFLLDTGTSRSYLTPKGFARLQAAGGTLEKDGTLTVSGLSIQGLTLPAINFDREAKGYPKLTIEGNADGYIGTDVLENFRLGLNLSKNEIRLWSAKADIGLVLRTWFAPILWKAGIDGRYEVTDLGTKEQRYSMWLNLNNISVPTVVDTGSPVTLIRSDLLDHLQGGRKSHSGRARYYGGSLDYDQYRVDWVGPWRTSLADERRIASLDPKVGYPGIAGRDILKPFSVILDYPGRKAFFCGKHTKPLPSFDGIEAYLPIGIVVRYPKGPLHLPAGSSCHLPAGYLEVCNKDTSLDILPPETVWSKSASPEVPGDRPTQPPAFRLSEAQKARWYPGIGWTIVPNIL